MKKSEKDKNTNKNMKQEQTNFKDKSYLEKRKTMRIYSTKPELEVFLDIMTDSIYNKLLIFPGKFNLIDEISLYHHIKTLLIDGYLAFEKIYDGDEVIELKQIDSITIVPTNIDGARGWIQHPDDDKMKRVLFDSQIAYISLYDSGDSYIGKLIKAYDELNYAEMRLFTGDDIDDCSLLKKTKWFYKKLVRLSIIPKSILKHEKANTADIRFNSFVGRVVDKIDNVLI